MTNALSSFEEGILAYQKAKTQIVNIKLAALQTFHCIELLLKIRLEQRDPSALAKNPNNPTVIKALQKQGIYVSSDEIKTINELRKLRNSLQHDEASFNYRSALALLQRSLVCIARFTLEELGIWVAEEISPEAWQVLLKFEPIRTKAESIVSEIIEHLGSNSG